MGSLLNTSNEDDVNSQSQDEKLNEGSQRDADVANIPPPAEGQDRQQPEDLSEEWVHVVNHNSPQSPEQKISYPEQLPEQKIQVAAATLSRPKKQKRSLYDIVYDSIDQGNNILYISIPNYRIRESQVFYNVISTNACLKWNIEVTYTGFAGLHARMRMVASNLGVALPDFPRNYSKLFYNHLLVTFIEPRLEGLERYLNGINSDPTLRWSWDFVQFLLPAQQILQHVGIPEVVYNLEPPQSASRDIQPVGTIPRSREHLFPKSRKDESDGLYGTEEQTAEKSRQQNAIEIIPEVKAATEVDVPKNDAGRICQPISEVSIVKSMEIKEGEHKQKNKDDSITEISIIVMSPEEDSNKIIEDKGRTGEEGDARNAVWLIEEKVQVTNVISVCGESDNDIETVAETQDQGSGPKDTGLQAINLPTEDSVINLELSDKSHSGEKSVWHPVENKPNDEGVHITEDGWDSMVPVANGWDLPTVDESWDTATDSRDKWEVALNDDLWSKKVLDSDGWGPYRSSIKERENIQFRKQVLSKEEVDELEPNALPISEPIVGRISEDIIEVEQTELKNKNKEEEISGGYCSTKDGWDSKSSIANGWDAPSNDDMWNTIVDSKNLWEVAVVNDLWDRKSLNGDGWGLYQSFTTERERMRPNEKRESKVDLDELETNAVPISEPIVEAFTKDSIEVEEAERKLKANTQGGYYSDTDGWDSKSPIANGWDAPSNDDMWNTIFDSKNLWEVAVVNDLWDRKSFNGDGWGLYQSFTTERESIRLNEKIESKVDLVELETNTVPISEPIVEAFTQDSIEVEQAERKHKVDTQGVYRSNKDGWDSSSPVANGWNFPAGKDMWAKTFDSNDKWEATVEDDLWERKNLKGDGWGLYSSSIAEKESTPLSQKAVSVKPIKLLPIPLIALWGPVVDRWEVAVSVSRWGLAMVRDGWDSLSSQDGWNLDIKPDGWSGRESLSENLSPGHLTPECVKVESQEIGKLIDGEDLDKDEQICHKDAQHPEETKTTIDGWDAAPSGDRWSKSTSSRDEWDKSASPSDLWGAGLEPNSWDTVSKPDGWSMLQI